MLSIEPCVINGETSDRLVVIKMPRKAFHPGAISLLIEEVAVVSAYVRGQFFHIWVVAKEDSDKFLKHLQKFEPKDLMTYLKDLRKQFPKTEDLVDKAADLVEQVQEKLNAEGAGFTIDLKAFAPQLPKDPPKDSEA